MGDLFGSDEFDKYPKQCDVEQTGGHPRGELSPQFLIVYVQMISVIKNMSAQLSTFDPLRFSIKSQFVELDGPNQGFANGVTWQYFAIWCEARSAATTPEKAPAVPIIVNGPTATID